MLGDGGGQTGGADGDDDVVGDRGTPAQAQGPVWVGSVATAPRVGGDGGIQKPTEAFAAPGHTRGATLHPPLEGEGLGAGAEAVDAAHDGPVTTAGGASPSGSLAVVLSDTAFQSIRDPTVGASPGGIGEEVAARGGHL